MTIGEELEGLRCRLVGCQAVAFADLSTGMVLASSTAEKLTQEKLDALCNAGVDVLFGPHAQEVISALSDAAPRRPQIAMQCDAERMLCVICAPPPAQEALCFWMQPDAAVSALPQAASDILVRITAEN